MYTYILLLNLISPGNVMTTTTHKIYAPGLTVCEIQARLYVPHGYRLISSFCKPA